jgi:GAF domain-containing protein
MVDLAGQTQLLQPLTDAVAVIDEGLEDALAVLRADRGNVQLVDPISGSLRIAAQAGFSDEFLEYFAVVDDDGGSACAIAARDHAQTVIADVNADPRYAPHREIAAASGYRAVQSTPLVDVRGHLLGMLSTHYPYPYRPPDEALEVMQRLGELMGQAIEACLEGDGQEPSLTIEELLDRRASRSPRTDGHVHATRSRPLLEPTAGASGEPASLAAVLAPES